MYILEVNNLSKHYVQGNQTTLALDDVSFKVEKGEFVAIMGPSGSGKSTLLHILGCVDSPTSGQIKIEGVDVLDLNESKLTIFRRRHIGLVYQFYNLIPLLDVKDNICLPLLLDNQKVNEDYFNTLVDSLDIRDRLEHFPNQLSGGQQQRVAIARSLMNRPALLLADEPTGNLDSDNAQEIIRLLKQSHEMFKQTILLVTHDEEIARHADRILYLRDGKLISDEVI